MEKRADAFIWLWINGSYNVCSVFTEHSLGLWDIKHREAFWKPSEHGELHCVLRKEIQAEGRHLNVQRCEVTGDIKCTQDGLSLLQAQWQCLSWCGGFSLDFMFLQSKGMWILLGNSISITTSTPERHGERQITSCMEFYVDSECGGTTLWSSVPADWTMITL